MARRQSFGRYEPQEVLTLVEEYEELKGLDSPVVLSTSSILIRLIDIRRGYASLGTAERAAVLLCGFMGMTTREAAAAGRTSKSRIARDYRLGLEKLIRYLNGEV